jgi:hypothetical protein
MFRVGAGVMLALTLLAIRAQAEEPERRDVYTVKPWLDGSIIVTGALASGLPLALSNTIVTVRCPCNEEQLPKLDRKVVGNENGALRTTSDVTLGLAIAAPFIVDYFDVGWSRTLLDDTIIAAEAFAVNGAFTTLFKYTVQRPMPQLFDSPTRKMIDSGQHYLAFYSGHISITFTMLSVMAMTLNLRHGFSIWPWAIAAVVGTSMGVERIIAGQHFYTDAIVAAIMGTATGILVPWLHARSRWGTPTVSSDAGAVVVGWRRTW